MAHTEFDLESELPPHRVIAGLTDFSDRRPELWPGLNPKEYRVYERGDTWPLIPDRICQVGAARINA